MLKLPRTVSPTPSKRSPMPSRSINDARQRSHQYGPSRPGPRCLGDPGRQRSAPRPERTNRRADFPGQDAGGIELHHPGPSPPSIMIMMPSSPLFPWSNWSKRRSLPRQMRPPRRHHLRRRRRHHPSCRTSPRGSAKTGSLSPERDWSYFGGSRACSPVREPRSAHCQYFLKSSARPAFSDVRKTRVVSVRFWEYPTSAPRYAGRSRWGPGRTASSGHCDCTAPKLWE